MQFGAVVRRTKTPKPKNGLQNIKDDWEIMWSLKVCSFPDVI